VTRVAAIDCGTNSIRMLVADISGGRLADVLRRLEIVRLGQGVDRTGRLAPEAIERTRRVLAEYAGQVREAGVDRVRMVATSASRDAANRDDFRAMVLDTLGTEPEVITGEEEAALSFTGAVRGLAAAATASAATTGTATAATAGTAGAGTAGTATAGTASAASAGAAGAATTGTATAASASAASASAAGAASGPGQPPYLVADIGGGSTELVLGSAAVEAAASVDVGCVRLTERHLADDPPTAGQIAAAEADINAAIATARAAVPLAQARTVVGLAGSVTTVAAIALGLPEYDSGRIHHSRISAEQIRAVTGSLLRMTRAERAALPVMHPGRVDVIGGGALVLRVLVDELGAAGVIVSEHDILDGIAWSIA
jgi:exopolyphosphatase/guanosine-5'-triphosphate,3'-diphosphate pyrophosphatase